MEAAEEYLRVQKGRLGQRSALVNLEDWACRLGGWGMAVCCHAQVPVDIPIWSDTFISVCSIFAFLGPLGETETNDIL